MRKYGFGQVSLPWGCYRQATLSLPQKPTGLQQGTGPMPTARFVNQLIVRTLPQLNSAAVAPDSGGKIIPNAGALCFALCLQIQREKAPMSISAKKTEAGHGHDLAEATRPTSGTKATAQLMDKRPVAVAQRKMQEAIKHSPRVGQLASLQKKANKTGLPDSLKSGVENLSGHAMDDVQVHYNSGKPQQLQAHAYAQGTDIHVAPGQEQHLPHEAWHVAQQKQGRVKPTMQMKAGVPVNDDAGLEREADIMGQRSLGALAAPAQLRAHAVRGSAPVQLVKDKASRPGLDARMDGLKSEALDLLGRMMAEGKDWKKTYGEKGKEKGSGILSDKKTDRVAEARNALLKEGWKRLTPMEKTQVVWEATKLTGGAIAAALRGVRELVGLLPESESEPSEKGKAEKKPKPREEDSSGSWLDGLTREHLEAMQEAYSLVRKGQKKYNEAKDTVRQKGGEIGQAVGAEVGKVRDEVEFERRLGALRDEFHTARGKYGRLELAIDGNEDRARYSRELEALGRAVMDIVGPAMVYAGEGLNETGRRQFPQVCADAIAAIRASSRSVGLMEKATSLAERGTKAVTGMLDGGTRERAEIETAQRDLATQLSQVVNQSWKKQTWVRSTPTTVSAIKRALPKQATNEAKLQAAVELATAASSAKSSNRTAETQQFYSTLAGLRVGNLDSLRGALSALEGLAAKLG